MANGNEQTKSCAWNGNEITMVRLVNAPRELVYQLWTTPEHIAKWWGPNGFTNTIHEMDVKPGGVWRYMMHGPDGTDYPNRIKYLAVEPGRLEYDHDSDVDNDPNQFHVTVTFEALGNQTKVTMHSIFASAEVVKMLVEQFGVLEGGMQTLDRLEAQVLDVLPDDQLTIIRTVNAPRELVFDVWSKAEHIAKWWGPKGAALDVVKFDFAYNGMLLYRMQHPSGMDMWAKFVYREIISPEKMVFVSSFSDADGGTTGNPWLPVWPLEILNVLTFTEVDGKTTLTLRGGPLNATEEEMNNYKAMRINMQQGFAGTFEKLDEYLSELQK